MEKLTPVQIKEKIQQAEESVSNMRDEVLKKVAFETVLAQLLGTTNGSSHSHSKKWTKNSENKKRSSSRNPQKTPRTEQKTSVIELNVEQLKGLKEFYDKYAPDGTEAAVFTLAYFIHENLKQRQFHIADLQTIYQNLLPLKPITKPLSMSPEEIKRAVGWLVAPSRKKQWLKDAGNGLYEISPQGLLHVTYEVKEAEK